MPRDYLHDYRARCIYHITLSKREGVAPFSRVGGSMAEVQLELSPIGKAIEEGLLLLPSISGSLRLLQYVIMPDHIHFLVFVTDRLERSLGSYIGTFKALVKSLILERLNQDLLLFDKDYYDRILRPTHSLDVIYKYIRENPRRLLARRLTPGFFSRVNDLVIDGRSWQAYGNLHLLDNPFKDCVVVHRRDSAEVREKNRNRWLYTASNGCVLVSPFISEAEKGIRDEAVACGGKFVFLSNEPFGDRYKPSGRSFELCEQGRLLIVAPKEKLEAGRQTFLFLNSVAARIVAVGSFGN